MSIQFPTVNLVVVVAFNSQKISLSQVSFRAPVSRYFPLFLEVLRSVFASLSRALRSQVSKSRTFYSRSELGFRTSAFGKLRKHSPEARVFYISLVFSNDCRVSSQCNTRLIRLLYLLNNQDYELEISIVFYYKICWRSITNAVL